jgi:hypothetical protein
MPLFTCHCQENYSKVAEHIGTLGYIPSCHCIKAYNISKSGFAVHVYIPVYAALTSQKSANLIYFAVEAQNHVYMY